MSELLKWYWDAEDMYSHNEYLTEEVAYYNAKKVDALIDEKDKEIERHSFPIMAERAEEAERKLKTATDALKNIRNIDDDDMEPVTKAYIIIRKALTDIEGGEKPNKNHTSASSRLSEAARKANPWLDEPDWEWIRQRAEMRSGSTNIISRLAKAILSLKEQMTK